MTDHPPADFMFGPRVFVRVYRLPEKLTNGFCFGGGVSISMLNVDWFEVRATDGRDKLTAYIKKKRYFDASARFLLLGDTPEFTFTIDPPDRSAGVCPS